MSNSSSCKLCLLALLLVSCSAPPPTPRTPPPPPPPPPIAAPRQLPKIDLPQSARRCAVIFQEVGSEPVLELGSDRPFEAASLVKLPILAELYRQAQQGKLKLSDRMVFEERFRVGGSGILQQEAAGKSYSLEELGRLMIIYSDNVATDMLLDKLGMQAVEEQAHRIGMRDTTVRRTIYDFAAIDQGRDNLVSARDMLVFFQQLAAGKLPGSAAMRKVLEQQTRNEMIPAGLPRGTRVAHKSGELTGILHDCGIVSTPRGDYILILLGEFDDREPGVAAWKKVSKGVYDAFNR